MVNRYLVIYLLYRVLSDFFIMIGTKKVNRPFKKKPFSQPSLKKSEFNYGLERIFYKVIPVFFQLFKKNNFTGVSIAYYP